jgi:RNA polymerase sigma-70 factor (ECF subfamily)
MTRDDSRSFPAPANADELLRHAAWLRALARTLVGEADADDVVQETWVAAVARRPSAVHSLRAWLGAVARNVVRQSARAAVRRREREAVAARRDDAPSTDEVVARAARMRELVERVLALDEPYRSTILPRFFEGVKPQEIARRVGASEEAVRQRLKRGLDRLREQLDAEHGGERERWIAGLAPLTVVHGAPIAATSGGMVVKGVFMSSPARFAVAGLVVAVVASVAFWFPRSRVASDGPRAANAENVSTAKSDAPAAATSDATANAPQPVRAADGSNRVAAAAVEDAGGPVRFVYGAVVDESGIPLDDARFTLWTVGSSEVAAPNAKSPWSLYGRDGVWSTAGVTPGIWHVEAQREGFSTFARDFTIDDSSEGHRVDVVLKRALVIPVRFRSPKGGPLADAMAEEASEGLLCNIAVSGFPRAPPARFEIGFVYAGQLAGAGHWFARVHSPFSVAQESKPTPTACWWSRVSRRRSSWRR